LQRTIPRLAYAIPVQQAAPELRRIEKLYRLQPPKGPPQKVPSARYCAFLHSPKKAKVGSLFTRTAGCFSIQQQSF
jgi:hypothetical protein